MRHPAVSLLVVCALAAQAIPQKDAASAAPQKTTARKIPCKTDENASICYWTHGRLSLYNGNPAFRIWKVGTKRILGVYSGPRSERVDPLDNEHPEFPAALDRVYDREYKRKAAAKDPDAQWPDSVYGDFEVCPLEPEKKGEMQAACIESAKVTAVEDYVPRY